MFVCLFCFCFVFVLFLFCCFRCFCFCLFFVCLFVCLFCFFFFATVPTWVMETKRTRGNVMYKVVKNNDLLTMLQEKKTCFAPFVNTAIDFDIHLLTAHGPPSLFFIVLQSLISLNIFFELVLHLLFTDTDCCFSTCCLVLNKGK